jgi:hypothetical protein
MTVAMVIMMMGENNKRSLAKELEIETTLSYGL